MIKINTLFHMILICSCMGTCFGFMEIIVAAGSYLYQKLPCFSGACCTKNEIPANYHALEASLKDKLFGQPLVLNTVVNALKSHWNDNYRAEKALTMSFHGGPGVGKNYVTKMIQEALYTQGTRSPHVHMFVARLDFPEVSKVPEYQRNLARWIKGNVTNCPKQIFIFDEVNHMPAGVLDAIKPFIDYYDYINRINFREVIFIFLSNTGAQIVNEHTYTLWRKGIKKDEMKLSDFEKLISQGAFNEKVSNRILVTTDLQFQELWLICVFYVLSQIRKVNRLLK
ncbi:hypothetical protein HHI36_017638 [Cryptolaemus montrouzieri]|uniref:Uncharacterized protein n=1 Tax=Cryptolaemus montrouzieri TaxID=559131 RepID=A0ABD2NNF1_9CUCU